MTLHPDSEANRTSIERVCDSFWEVEAKHSLLSWEVDGVFPWPLFRMQLYYKITQQVGLFDAPHPLLKANKAAFDDAGKKESRFSFWIRRNIRQVLNLAHRKFFGATDKPYGLLMGSGRGGVDLYTDALRKELGSKAMLIDRALNSERVDGSYHLGSMRSTFRKLYQPKQPYRFAPEHQRIGDAIRQDLSRALQTDVGDVGLECRRRTVDFLKLSTGFEEFFKVNPVETLFLSNSYNTTISAALEGARRNGARIVELQHGFISRFHLGYSWPGRPYVPYRPDELWCFGDFWHESTPLPGQTKARVIGAPYVHELAGQHGGARGDDLVMFSSQGVIGRRLFDVAVETARRRPEKQVLFRLHPNELLEDYEAVIATLGTIPANFALSHKDPNIFALLSKTSIQVGAFSTTLFEGMSLGCRTVVVDLPGCEYMRPVAQRGDVLFVRDVNELVARLDDAPYAKDTEYYYAKPVTRLVGA